MKHSETIKNELIMIIKYKLGLLKEEIINIDYAIQWAKAKIVNSYILSNEEINTVKEIIIKEKSKSRI